MPPVVPFGNPYEVLSSVGIVDVEVTQYEMHVPVDDSETFLRGELAHGYRSIFDVLPSDLSRDDEWSWSCGSGWTRCVRMAASFWIVSPVFAKGVEPRR
jgi:hypothetical protein